MTLARAIAPELIVRVVRLRGLTQEERLTKAVLGVDAHLARRTLTVVLEADAVPATVARRISSSRAPRS